MSGVQIMINIYAPPPHLVVSQLCPNKICSGLESQQREAAKLRKREVGKDGAHLVTLRWINYFSGPLFCLCENSLPPFGHRNHADALLLSRNWISDFDRLKDAWHRKRMKYSRLNLFWSSLKSWGSRIGGTEEFIVSKSMLLIGHISSTFT